MFVAIVCPHRTWRRARFALAARLLSRIDWRRKWERITVASPPVPEDGRGHSISHGVVNGLTIPDRQIANCSADHPSGGTGDSHLTQHRYLRESGSPREYHNPNSDGIVAGWIGKSHRLISHISVEVLSPNKFDRILSQEPATLRVVVSGAVVIKASFGVELAGGVL
jgi:hypothetical protein